PDQSVIKQAISHWTQKVPCITFVPRTTQNDYISFFVGQGCYSWTGRTGGKQRISIGSGCANMGVIAHEIGHALGFWHEQSRPDRDSYVRILWSNIQIEKVGDFKKIMNGGTNDLGVAYDFNSLMHYGPTAFAKAVGLNTIEKLNGNTDFGQTNGLSDKDIEQARLLYCPGTNACSSLYADSNGSCAGWAALGHCDNPTYKAFMDTNCKKSCVCGGLRGGQKRIFDIILEANSKASSNIVGKLEGAESLFQGDIVMTDDIREALRTSGADSMTLPPSGTSSCKRAVSSVAHYKWPKVNGVVEVPCYSWIGRTGGKQRISIGSGCAYMGVIAHEIGHALGFDFDQTNGLSDKDIEQARLLYCPGTNACSSLYADSNGSCAGWAALGHCDNPTYKAFMDTNCKKSCVCRGHALGFWHEQSRPDRDRYVKIYWNNIIPRYKYAFHKYADGRINSLGVPYDYDSVMHYNSRAFGIGNRITITRTDGSTRLGNPKGLSPKDIKQARLLYCGSGGTRPTRPQPPTPRPPIGMVLFDFNNYYHHQ
ncbi:hypothetical protein QZH41_016815, partial [Actinostola sp. cb2023]